MPCECVYADENLREKCDELTQMLCWLCGTLEEYDEIQRIKENPKLKEWWKEHQKIDTDRVKYKMKEIKRKNNRLRNNKQVLVPAEIAEEFITQAEAVHCVSHFHKRWFHKLALEIFVEE